MILYAIEAAGQTFRHGSYWRFPVVRSPGTERPLRRNSDMRFRHRQWRLMTRKGVCEVAFVERCYLRTMLIFD